MRQQHMLSQLFKSGRYPQNLNLLKKIILTSYLGRLQINGLPPDDKICLADYMFDSENIIFDFTRLSDEKRKTFEQWLLEPHQNEKSNSQFRNVELSEYRGFTAEVFLSWWGSIKNWFQRRYSDYWTVADFDPSADYQLLGIDILHGKQGMLVGFDQFLPPASGTKYHNPKDSEREPLGNTKRVFLTEHLVDQLINSRINDLNFDSICEHAHPYSISVNGDIQKQERLNQMHDYRKMQRFVSPPRWYIRLWNLLWPWSKTPETKSSIVPDNILLPLLKKDSVQIFKYSKTHEILVIEKKPEIENIVFCGGGAKIFAHVGFWKAVNEIGIKPVRYAGSSAGAIMALLCYLGYSSEEIAEVFQNFRQEHIIHFDLSINGISDSRPLKTALDYIIARKLEQIVTKYGISYPQGTITFAKLEAIRAAYPDCGIGKELIVTATNKKKCTTSYFSLQHSPDFEISEAVKVSSSLPIIYRSTMIGGQEHIDGGVLTNFPTEAFFDNYSTLLESEFGNNLQLLAVQFDNGTERTAIDLMKRKVYRENFFSKWIYSLLTGVKDPVSGWEQDRMKLRKHSSQSVVINVDKVSASSFSVDDDARSRLIESGYRATMDYINARYFKNEKNQCYEHDEVMHTKFSSLSDLLAYCCYRGNELWFDEVRLLIDQSDSAEKIELQAQAEHLKTLYFSKKFELKPRVPKLSHSLSFFNMDQAAYSHKILLAVYPVFLKLTPEMLKDSTDRKICDEARHFCTLKSPFTCLNYFEKIAKPNHIFLHLVINLLKQLEKNTHLQNSIAVKNNPEQLNEVMDNFAEILRQFEKVGGILTRNTSKYKKAHYANWKLDYRQTVEVIDAFHNSSSEEVVVLLESMPKQVRAASNPRFKATEPERDDGLYSFSFSRCIF